MKRRDLLTLTAGATLGALLPAHAQQVSRRIAVLTGYVDGGTEARRRVGAFGRRLQELGWSDGRNLAVDYYWGAADNERVRALAAQIVKSNPDAVFAAGTSAALALQAVTRSVPVVFTQVDDPVGAGVVASLARPGGNLTGFTPFEHSLGPKMLELLKAIAPALARATFVMNPDSAFHAATLRVMKETAPSFGVEIVPAPVRTIEELERTINDLARLPNSGVVVPSITLTNIHRERLLALLQERRLPAIYPFSHYVQAGGLISYGTDPAEQFREAASYIDRILKGEKVSNLPVQTPTKFELAINLKTARSLGIEIPSKLLFTADEVIE